MEISYRDLFKSLSRRPLLEILYRDLARTPHSYGDLVQPHCLEICCRDLAKRSLTSILPRDQESFYRELVQKFYIEILYRDIP